jgi:hypothetical protein
MATAPTAPMVDAWPQVSTGQITFYWRAPASDGGDPITKYTLSCAAISYSQDVSATRLDFTVTGLTDKTDYVFQVTATNGIGASPAATFPVVQPGATPFGPTVATASTLNTSTALVSWTPSTLATEGALRAYSVQVIPSTPAISSYFITMFPFKSTMAIAGLSTNTYYQFLVRGVNDVGYCAPFAYTSTLGFGIVSGAFSPSSLTGMALWLDANSSNNFTLTGSNITTWADRSPNAYTATKGGANNLLFSTTAVHFTNGSYLTIPDAAPLRLQMSSFSIYGVYRTVPTGQTQFLMSKFIDGGSYDGWNLRAAQNGNGYVRPAWYAAGGSPDYVLTSTPIVDGTYRTLSMYQSNTTLQTYVDGSFESSIQTTRPTSATVPLNIGVRQTSGTIEPFTGSVREIIMYSNAITPFDRQKVEGYLAWKWGMQTQLPAIHPFKLAAPTSASVFSPSSFSSMQLWLDAADATTLTVASGSNISAWADKSGQSNNVSQATANNQPTSYTSGNGLTGMRFVAGSGGNWFRGILNTPITTTTMTAYTVLAMNTNTQAYGRALSLSPLNSNDFFGGGANFARNNTATQLINEANSGGVASSIALSTLTVVGTVIDGTNQYQYMNGTNTASRSLSMTFNVARVGVGFQAYAEVSGSSDRWDGAVNEVLVFNRALSTDDRQTVEGYLAWKWGLQGNLPTAHPYKFLSPASNYSGTVVPQGLLVRFDANTYSGSGTWTNTAALGSSNNATLVTGSNAKNGAGNGIVLNGSTGWRFNSVGLQTSYSITVWYKRTGDSDNLATVVTEAYGGTNGINMAIVGANGGAGTSATQVAGGFYTNANGWQVGTILTLTSNVWNNITVTWDNSSKDIKTYYNGVLSTTVNKAGLTPVSSGSPYYFIGQTWDGDTRFVRGEIGQILIYNRAITAAEVAQNYAATSNVYTV